MKAEWQILETYADGKPKAFNAQFRMRDYVADNFARCNVYVKNSRSGKTQDMCIEATLNQITTEPKWFRREDVEDLSPEAATAWAEEMVTEFANRLKNGLNAVMTALYEKQWRGNWSDTDPDTEIHAEN